MSNINFFTTAVNEPVSYRGDGWKKFVNFSENYISFGKTCYLIDSKTGGVLDLNTHSRVVSAAEKIAKILLTILLIPVLVCTLVKLSHRLSLPKNVNIIAPLFIQTTIPPVNTAITPPVINTSKFGAGAFIAPNEGGFPQITPLSNYNFNELLNRYKDFNGYHPNNSHKSIKDLLEMAYFQGEFYAAVQQVYGQYKDEIQKMMRLIIRELANDKVPQAKRNKIAERLGEAFRSCQAVQFRTVQEIAGELVNLSDLPGTIRLWWQERKMEILNQIIIERHPHCNDQFQDIAQQFTHLQSGYITKFGDKLGLTGVAQANLDPHKSYNVAHSIEADFKGRLNLDVFAREIALDINNPKEDCSRLDKTLVYKWIASGDAPKLPEGQGEFGYYAKTKKYADMVKPTEDQGDGYQPFMTVEEAMQILHHLNIAE